MTKTAKTAAAKTSKKTAAAKTSKKTAAAKEPAAKAAKKVGEAPAIEPDFMPVVEAFAEDERVTCEKMMASVGLKVGGKIFAMMVKGQLVAKLPKARVDELARSGKGGNFTMGQGRVMKEWVTVAPGAAPWVDLAKEAYGFVKEGRS